MGTYKYKKVHVDLPGQPYYKYDDSFKRKIIHDIDAGLISARKPAVFCNLNRKTIERWRTELAGSKYDEVAEVTEQVKPANNESIAMISAEFNVEIKKLREQLAHERLRSEALQSGSSKWPNLIWGSTSEKSVCPSSE